MDWLMNLNCNSPFGHILDPELPAGGQDGVVGREPPGVIGSSSRGEVARLPVVRVAVLAGGQQVDVTVPHPGHCPAKTYSHTYHTSINTCHMSYVKCCLVHYSANTHMSRIQYGT